MNFNLNLLKGELLKNQSLKEYNTFKTIYIRTLTLLLLQPLEIYGYLKDLLLQLSRKINASN